MRIVFVGTPQYAVPSLEALAGLKPRHEVVAVVTQPDRPVKRSKKPAAPPVKEAALRQGLPPERILQPASINAPEMVRVLRELEPDILCVVAYGGLLKKDVLTLSKLYPINAHGSLLPKFRGAAPIQAAILEGEEETGVSIMKIEQALDSGPVMLQREIHIQPEDTAGTLHDKLSALSAICFLDAVRLIEEGKAYFAPQDHTQATRAPKLTKDSGVMDWNREATYLERFVRAMTPWPGAWTHIASPDGSARRRVRIVRAARPKRIGAAHSSAVTGEGKIISDTPENTATDPVVIECVCGDGNVLKILSVQPEGGNEMSVDEFLRGTGRPYATGCRLE